MAARDPLGSPEVLGRLTSVELSSGEWLQRSIFEVDTTMAMTKWILGTALTTGLLLSSSVVGFSQGPAPAQKPDLERHPHIRAAMRDLRQAENKLGTADHDFGGHRVKALELVKQAEGELREALEWAKAHPDSDRPPARSTSAKPH
jgi:hypothetical protein